LSLGKAKTLRTAIERINTVTSIAAKLTCFCGFLLIFIGGCGSTNGTSPVAEQITALKQERSELRNQLEEVRAEAERLKGQVESLVGLPEKVEPAKLYDLQSVRIGRFTNFYDKDKDGRKERLIVYVQPVDSYGDAIKAAGAVEVKLWDLDRPQHEALLGQWQVKTSEMKELWFDTFVGANYRLTFEISESVKGVAAAAGPLTVKVAFTDYSTGRIFTEQKTIEP